jgi:Family of unknown function (DUF6267)
MKLFEIKGQTPNFLLTESKNTHLEHVEDLVFNKGYAGAEEAVNYIDSLRHMLAEGTGTTTKLTVKWDGSPAIVCGVDPADSKFFVGTKSVFAKGEPKLCKSNRDIQNFYGSQPELAEMLASALKYLAKLGIGGVIQGDLMFTPGKINTVSVNDEDCYVFTPNTITYAVPVNSNLGQRVARAKIGIIFHTAYTGDSIDTMTATFGVNVSSLNPTADVWFDDATYKDYTGIASLTPAENTKIQKYLQATTNTMQKIGPQRFDIILQDKEFARMVKPFVNKMVRAGSHAVEPTQFIKQFITHYESEMMKGIEDLAGGPQGRAAQARLAKIQAKEQWIADNSNNLTGILAVYKRIIELKHMLLHKLQQVEGIGTFQKTNDGYQVTAPEGFVAIGHDGGAVKLVDRLAFSRTNFLSKS